MTPNAFLTKVLWIRRRARRIQRFYGISRPLAIFDAHLDWVRFQGLPALYLVNAPRGPRALNTTTNAAPRNPGAARAAGLPNTVYIVTAHPAPTGDTP